MKQPSYTKTVASSRKQVCQRHRNEAN